MRKSNGGVLIQLVIYMIFILVVLGVIQHFFDPIGQFTLSQDNQRVKDLLTIQNALETYYTNHGRYPAADDTYHIISLTNKPVAWGDNWNTYLQDVPKDPSGDRNYAYVVSPDKQAYYLYASLESPQKNAASCSGKCTNAPDNACGDTVVCNFGITSPNVSP